MIEDCTPSLRVRIEAFLRQFDDDCRSCLNRHMCSDCRASWAKMLFTELKLSDKPSVIVDNSIGARCRRVIEQLQQATEPIAASKIILPDCPAYLKEFTLNHMLNKGMICRKRTGYFYKYFLRKKHKKGCNK